jgi:hypothetical protein
MFVNAVAVPPMKQKIEEQKVYTRGPGRGILEGSVAGCFVGVARITKNAPSSREETSPCLLSLWGAAAAAGKQMKK